MRNERAEWLPAALGRALLTVLLATAVAASTSVPAFAASQDRIVVSLGDSYSSGEGCPPFYGQGSADKYSNEDWLAHRSENSWEGQLVLGDGTRLKDVKASQLAGGKPLEDDSRWYFYASSGAVAVNVYSAELASNAETILRDGKSRHRHAQPKTGNKHLVGEPFSEYVEVQIDEALEDLKADGLSGRDVDYVTISIGGNDIGFSDIVLEVALRGFGVLDRDYLANSLNKAWMSYDGDPRHVKARTDFAIEGEKKRVLIERCYERVCDEFPDAEVIVVGYPTLMNDDKWEKYMASMGISNAFNPIDRLVNRWRLFDWGLSEHAGFADWEAATVNADARLFNECLEAQVAECNKRLRDGGEDHDRVHFVSVLEGETTFDGHEAYTDEPFLNPVLSSQSEDLTSLPIPVSSYSFHPNYKGEAGGTDASEKPHDGISCYRIAVQRMLDKLEDERPLVAYLDGDKDAAVEFIQTWYSDWTFENGHEVQNAQPLILRCPPLIAEDSELFDEFIESCNSMTGKYSRNVALCVVGTPQVEELDDGVFRVKVQFVGTQNSVDQAMYDRLVANPSEDVWDVTVDKDNKITSLTEVDDNNSTTDDDQAAVKSGKTQDGTYILSGVVRTHDEVFYTAPANRTDSVVSIVLDEDFSYEYEYKGTVQAVAHEVLLATTGSEFFGAERYDEWAQYDGQHITVECDGLQGAYHDASYWNVDSLAIGEIRLIGADGAPSSSGDDQFDPTGVYPEIERDARAPIAHTYVYDFDGDGLTEAFVITGNENSVYRVGMLDDAEIWFVNNSGKVSKEAAFKGVLDWPSANPEDPTFETKGYRFVTVMDDSARVYGVKDGKARAVDCDLDGLSLINCDDTGQVYGWLYDNSTYMYQRYDLELDVKSFTFVSKGPIGEPFYAG